MRNETGGSRLSAAKRPSFYLIATFMALLLSALLSLRENEAPARHQDLFGKGWVPAGHPPCGGLAPGFYELDGEGLEFLVTEGGETLSAIPPPWPDSQGKCRPIPAPTFIKEIL